MQQATRSTAFLALLLVSLIATVSIAGTTSASLTQSQVFVGGSSESLTTGGFQLNATSHQPIAGPVAISPTYAIYPGVWWPDFELVFRSDFE